ncbi:MAG TPA: sigma 54-interacting transcriptional regulator, partial [Savagea sp.]
KFELAQNGTLFLDEIGDMPYPLQTKLLRVLQEKEFEPLGSHQTIQLDTKIIAATNRDLPSLIQQGKFREDLYYRLHIMPIHIPPLRERMEDLPSIVEEIIRDLNRSGFRIQGITHPALARLLTYDWPGNVRELYNMLERAVNLTTIHAEYYIDLHHLPEQVTPAKQDMPVRNRYEATKKEAERATIIQALREANGNKARASRLLGISRTWLYNQIQQFHIEEREYLD